MANFSIAAAGDDGHYKNDSTLNTSGAFIVGKGEIAIYSAWLRFANVIIPQGATIDTAYITITKSSSAGATVKTNIYGVDEDNHVAPTNTTEWTADHGAHTTASVAWNFTPAATNQTPSLVSIIQEIVDRANWAVGNAIGIHIDDNSSSADNYEIIVEQSAVLTVTFSTSTPWLRSASSNRASDTSVVVTAPAGIADGDILICSGHAYKGTGMPTLSWPSGFTEICVRGSGWTNLAVGIAWKRASSESGNYTVTSDSGTVTYGAISCFRGCLATGDPTDNYSNTNYTTTDTILRAAQITTTVDNDVVVFAGFTRDTVSTSVAPPSGLTEATETAGSDGGFYWAHEQSYIRAVSAGATGAKDGTLGDDSNVKHAFLVGLKTATTATWAGPYYYKDTYNISEMTGGLT